jgi:glycosyltransferase involved in cell wall biosynthesis
MKPLTVTLYGQFNGHWSNAGVSRGLAAGLHANGVALKLVGEQGLYECLWTLPRHVARKPPDVELCASVPQSEGVGMYVGYPARATALQGHPVKVGAFICESEILPADWGVVARSCDLVVVPSAWVKYAYLAAGVLPERLLVVPHGLHPVYQQVSPAVGVHELAGLSFLHVAGARDFIDRKGTLALIEAFAHVFDPASGTMRQQKALLVIRTPPSSVLVEAVRATRAPYLFHFDWHEAALPPERMHDYLSRGDWAAVIQPSRAEAFGIVPVEARAMGIPVIQTKCSGHAAHAEDWDLEIESGAVGPIAVQGIPNGVAPTVPVDSIIVALQRFVLKANERKSDARLRAGGYARKYNWADLTAPLVKRLRELAHGGRTLAGRTVGR